MEAEGRNWKREVRRRRWKEKESCKGEIWRGRRRRTGKVREQQRRKRELEGRGQRRGEKKE